MSTRKAPENASGSKGLKPWMKNLIFAAVILVLAAALYFGVRAAHSSKGSGLQATVDFGDGITETLPLDTDHDLYSAVVSTTTYTPAGTHAAHAPSLSSQPNCSHTWSGH